MIPIPQGGDDDEEQDDDAMFLELVGVPALFTWISYSNFQVWDRVNRAADCAVCAMHIMTSRNMNKRVFLDDVIDRVAQFVRFHLQNTIYPSFDPVYKVSLLLFVCFVLVVIICLVQEMSKNKDGYIGSMKKKRTYAPSVKDKKILNIYNRCTELVGSPA